MSLSDDEYAELMRGILLAEPCRGVCTEPTRLLDHVYIGSQSNAESLRLLRQIGITHVLNCAGYKGPRPVPNASPYEGLGIDYYEFQAEDTDRYDICQHFPEAFRYLDLVKRQGGIALVHCALGINRSAAVCLGYLMKHSRIPLLEATKIMKDKRRIVLANRHFQRLLVFYARTRGLLDRIEVGKSSHFALNYSPSRNDVLRASEHSSYRPVSVYLTHGQLSSSNRHQVTLPRRTSNGPTSRDAGIWMDRPSSSGRSHGCSDIKWLDHICERMDSITKNDNVSTTEYCFSRPLTASNPRTRRAQSTPRLITSNGIISPTNGLRRMYESFGKPRPLEFRY